MAKPCERCKKSRIHLSILFAALIIINFATRSALNIGVNSVSDILLLPSFGVILSAIIIYLVLNKKARLRED